MKTLFALVFALALTAGCASRNPRGGTIDGGVHVRGTTGLGVGSDTTTQTGIDTGTRSGSELPPR